MDPERLRLQEAASGKRAWKRWGPYLSERQWGTVREDYSPGGDAWGCVTHDMARSHAYVWGEDGIAGFSDQRARVCLGLALWNEHDPILKERLFGLTNDEGNHGEDVKELYYYLDATPTHSYLKMLYKYPQREFPYSELVSESRRRSRDEPEFEILDTKAFQHDRYFDVVVEYAKADANDVLMLVTAYNRGPDSAPLRILPHVWLRDTWSGGTSTTRKPQLGMADEGHVAIDCPRVGKFGWQLEGTPEYLFCENATNPHGFSALTDDSGYYKDGVNNYVVQGDRDAVNPAKKGTKAAAHYRFRVPAGGSVKVRLRLSNTVTKNAFKDFDKIVQKRRREADEFYAVLQSDIKDADARAIQRQAFAGLIWSKQFYGYKVQQWLDGDLKNPDPPEQRQSGRNSQWKHLNNADIISMPDKWEYPWYASWDLAFHCLPLAMIDPEFAKHQLDLITREWYMHPNGQLPAYEWDFGDVNPPVHAWATWRVYEIDRKHHGKKDRAFLERVFHKLLLNFTWWVNRKDEQGRNVFQGGFLGLDNIGVFDRSAPVNGGHVDQADGTSWMAMYSLNMLRIALELATENPVYEDIATKFFEHFLYIAAAMNDVGGTGVGLWDEADGFYYDVLHLSSGEMLPMKVRSLVGLTPLFAVETIEPETLKKLPNFRRRLEWFLKNRPDLANLVSHWREPGRGDRRLLSLLRGHRMKCLLEKMLDESEFLSDYGVRSLSRYHKEHPYTVLKDGKSIPGLGDDNTVDYVPAESNSPMFGGNSNWRGPVWFPMNFLLIESLQKFHHYYGDDFQVECPTGSGVFVTIQEAADEISRRLSKLFLKDAAGRRPVFGDCGRAQNDPHFRDHLLFYEYFDGDTGRGVGASHQTGWTALIAKLLQPRG
ncbi:Mannosyl oligosaccharide glucosidase [Botrimarina colliarenosi]|uniref:Mannosyl oligosaccharide glucosidase n=1 Tax=Botrimarina colliarenosi TaxID=2528001 RepID=A0A5C6AC32_9BACT|nr:glucosidase [Botrimarina colliarenosi]TWT96980.1 Mannosyl oligosaccharide glucosidase [Botrimarina colliarenosi]